VADLLDIVCREASIDKEDVLEELKLKQRINSFFNREIFIPRVCSFDFHLKIKNTNYAPVGKVLRTRQMGKSKISGIFLLLDLFKTYGAGMLAAGFLKVNLRNDKKPWVHKGDIFKIGLRSWPTQGDLDLEENKKCQTGYYSEGRVLPFCYANILKEQGNGKILAENL